MMQRTYINSFSYMRIAACFSIIILHMLFASTVYFEDVMSSGDALFERVAEHLLMWGVPLFLMISGALLLDPEKELTAKKTCEISEAYSNCALLFHTDFSDTDVCI